MSTSGGCRGRIDEAAGTDGHRNDLRLVLGPRGEGRGEAPRGDRCASVNLATETAEPASTTRRARLPGRRHEGGRRRGVRHRGDLGDARAGHHPHRRHDLRLLLRADREGGRQARRGAVGVGEPRHREGGRQLRSRAGAPLGDQEGHHRRRLHAARDRRRRTPWTRTRNARRARSGPCGRSSSWPRPRRCPCCTWPWATCCPASGSPSPGSSTPCSTRWSSPWCRSSWSSPRSPRATGSTGWA